MTIRIGVLTVSDRAAVGQMKDEGGPIVEEVVIGDGMEIAARAIIPDDVEQIEETLVRWSDDLRLDVVFTTGGTGLGPRDVTPEATLRVAHRLVPGIAETVRASSLQQTQLAMLSRGTAVVRGTTLIVNLPGSPRGARQGAEILQPILQHAVAMLRGGQH